MAKENITEKEFTKQLEETMLRFLGIEPAFASPSQMYKTLAICVREKLTAQRLLHVYGVPIREIFKESPI